MSTMLLELIQESAADPLTRQRTAEEFLAIYGHVVLPNNSTHLNRFVDLTMLYLGGSNAKVSLLAFDMLDVVLGRQGALLAPYLLEHATQLMDKLGHTKEPVRNKAREILVKLMIVSSAQQVFDRLMQGLTHKQWLVRAGVQRVLQDALTNFGQHSLQVHKITPLVCKLMGDANSSVRDAALDTLTTIYTHMGDRWLQQVHAKHRHTIPDAKMALLMDRIDGVRARGEIGLNGEPIVVPVATITLAVATPTRQPNTPTFASTPSGSGLRRPLGPKKAGSLVGVDDTDRAQTSTLRAIQRTPIGSAMKRRAATTKVSGESPPQSLSDRTGAGALTEDDFTEAFGKVKAGALPTGRELTTTMRDIVALLGDDRKDWNKRVDALVKLRSLIASGVDDETEYRAEFKTLCVAMETIVKDLRSQTVREVCITIAYMTEELRGARVESICEAVMPTLLNLLQNSAKIMASSAYVCVQFVIKNVHSPKLLSVIAQLMTSKSREIRRVIFELLSQILRDWQPHEYERSMDAIINAIHTGIGDADSDARTASRQAWHQLRLTHPEAAENVLLRVDPSKRRQLTSGDMSNASSSQSISSVGRRPSQENIGFMPPRGYGMHRQQYGSNRSASEIDCGSARRAAQRQSLLKHNLQYSKPPTVASSRYGQQPPQQPLQPNNSLRSVPASPVGKWTMGGTTRIQTPRTASKPRLAFGSATPTNGRVAQSQPGSRSNSPTSSTTTISSRMSTNTSSAMTPRGRQAPAHSAYSPRRQSVEPSSTTPRIGATTAERLSIDALTLNGRSPHHFKLDDDLFDGMDDRSMTTSTTTPNVMLVAMSREDAIQMQQYIRAAVSASTTDRRAAFEQLSLLFNAGRSIADKDMKYIVDAFLKILNDPHYTPMAPFYTTLQHFVCNYNTQICSWFGLLMTQLLVRAANDNASAGVRHECRAALVLEMMLESFNYEMQYSFLLAHISSSPAHTTSTKLRVHQLNAIHSVIQNMSASSVANSVEQRTFVAHLANMTHAHDVKTADVRHAIAAVLKEMFTLNAADFSSLIRALPSREGDVVRAMLDVPAVSRPRQLDVADRLRATTEEIANYQFGAPNNGGSRDSGIVDAIAYAHNNGATSAAGAFTMSGDEAVQKEMIEETMELLSSTSASVESKVTAMNGLRRMTREGSFTLWEDNFKGILLTLLDMFPDDGVEHVDLRRAALGTLKDICQNQAPRFVDHASLTIMKVVKSYSDGDRDVKRAADECLKILATHLPPQLCLQTLNPLVTKSDASVLHAAIKMTTLVIEELNDDDAATLAPKVLPGIVAAFGHSESSVRKAAVFCLVAFNNKCGDGCLKPFLADMNGTKRKLLDVYIGRAKTSSTGTMSQTGAV